MKKIVFILLSVLSFAFATAQDVLPKPNPARLVNDAAGVLSSEQVAALEQKLVALDDSTSNQIAVVLIKSTGDYSIQEYAVKLFRAWGIGNKKTNNGVLILAAIDDRKVWIEVGYGLEGAIPDVMATHISVNEIVPEFKQGNYYQGIDNAITALTKAAVGEYKMPAAKKSPVVGSKGNSIFSFLILIIVVIVIMARGGRGGGRGGRGSGLGGIAQAVILSSLMGGGRSSGGGWGGGDSGGGGGFGGFGGGSSGGGGGGGSW
ncbi:MAG: TPM domain-containing protein [Bacteroidota bacterium]